MYKQAEGINCLEKTDKSLTKEYLSQFRIMNFPINSICKQELMRDASSDRLKHPIFHFQRLLIIVINESLHFGNVVGMVVWIHGDKKLPVRMTCIGIYVLVNVFSKFVLEVVARVE